MILLDTCTLLWITSSPEKLSPEAKQLIIQHSANLFVSSISAFEIGIKGAKGHLKLPDDTQKWWEKALEFHGISDLPVTADVAIQSTELPPLHRDPCDRMIIATSKIHELILLTPDPLIRQYPKIKTAW